MTDPAVSPADLLALAGELADIATDIHREARRALLRVVEKTSPFDLVTQVDREAEAAMVECLLAVRPHDGILGEEGASRDGSSGVRWIIDPLDGTANYVYGYPAHAVSIGVEIDGELSVGVVHDTARNIRFAAARGLGATAGGEPIHATDKDDPATALFATGFSFDPALRARQGEVLARLLPRIRDVRRSGAASVDLCALASGSVDVYYEGGLAWWDIAAGLVIAEEAGATVLRKEIEGYPRVSVAGANPDLLAALLPILRETGFPIG